MGRGRVLFTPELLIGLTRGRYEVVENAILDDAKVVSVGYEPQDRCVEIVVESPSLTTEGCDTLPAPVVRRLDGPPKDVAPRRICPSCEALQLAGKVGNRL